MFARVQLRHPRPDEAKAVLALYVARDLADIGRPDFTLEDVLADWAMPTFDLGTDAFLVEDADGALLGYAGIDHRGSVVIVDPAAEGRGAGTMLREALEARAAERGQPRRQIISAANTSAVEHLTAAGYARAHVHVRLRIDDLANVPAASDGIAVRTFDLDSEGRSVFAVVEGALAELDGNVEEDYETWEPQVRIKVDPLFRLAIDDTQGLAGGLLGERWESGVGYVAALGVAPRARGRGYGRALLLAAFAAFRAEGLTAAELSVHGHNAPATALYESVGMSEAFRQEIWLG